MPFGSKEQAKGNVPKESKGIEGNNAPDEVIPIPKEKTLDSFISDAVSKHNEEDNWKHRSTGMKCKTCMYYVEKNSKIGRCRRNAPTMNGWPAIFPTDWCGNHKLDETKI